MLLKTTLIMVIILNLSNNILAGNNYPNYNAIIGISGGLKKVDYSGINDQLKKYHKMNGITNSPTLGIEGIAIKHRFIFGASIITSYKSLDKRGVVSQNSIAKVSFSSLNLNAKAGILPFSNSNGIFFPYLGLCLESLWINTDMNYGIRTPDCFFQYSHKYSIYDFGLIYGITYNKVIKFKKGSSIKMVIGVDCGGIIAITDNNWKVDGEKIQYSPGIAVPQYDLRSVFMKIHLGFILSKR